ncbi:hypothetical protein IWX90DRAFT_487052 [Phyllosticta citrichinensis]|uniref:Uncharacterized protein n=1 Tax=Phyllosticta citrichinensis TaxID=1130410 RepID=A0ABR1XPZ2_9PEZI
MTASSNRGGTPNQQPHHRHNQHPQLRLPLSHHGLPRAPTSPSSSFSSRSNRYEALSNPHSSASSSATTTPTFIPHAGPKHQHNPSIASSSSTSTQINASTTVAAADASQRAASFFRYSRTGDAPPSPPMTPFSPSAFPSEASTPMVLSPALPPQTAASDDSVTQCCAHCRHCGGSVSEVTGSQQHQQQRSRSVEDVPSPVRRHASTRSLKHAESSVSSSASVEPPLASASKQVKRQQQEQSHSRDGSKGVDRGRPAARGSDGPDASTCVGGGGGGRADEPKTDQGIAAAPVPLPSSSLYVPPSSSSSSSSFSRMGKRIKAALGGPKKGATAAAAAAVPSGVRYTGADGAAERKMAKKREKERERDALVEVEEVGDVHWTEM